MMKQLKYADQMANILSAVVYLALGIRRVQF
jgi:hypothetical protein